MGVNTLKRAVLCATFLAAYALFASCSSGGIPPGNPQEGVPISAALDELKSLENPGNVDAKVFAELKSALYEKLTEVWGENARFAAKAPLGDAGRVTDLAYNSGSGELDWSYVNVGDYDVSGEVGIPDITPIALNYLALTTDGIGDDAYETWIDGDGSGEIGIPDITAIALGYMNSVFAYEILTSASENGAYSAIGTVNFPSPSQFPVTFASALPAGNLGWIRVRPMDATGAPGEPSNAVAIPVGNQPPEASFIYAQQTSGFTVDFDASASHDPDGAILKYEWDWNGDGTYDFDAGSLDSASHDYVQSGNYECTLRVTDDGGESGTFSKTVYVVELATDWTLVDPFGATDNFSRPACAYIGSQATGAPGIAFYNGNFDSGFVLAADGYGATWGTVYTIDTDLIMTMALADVGGFPAIAYNDYAFSRLNYARAQDAEGAIWSAPVIPDSSVDAGRPYLNMLMVDNNPAIAYYNNDIGSVNFVRASDAIGGSWNAPIEIHSFPPSGTYPSAAILGTVPAVTYTNMSPVNPMFLKANDAQGNNWPPPTVVNSDGQSSGWTSLVVLNTSFPRPAIMGCANGSQSILMYRSADANGSVWDEPIVIANGSNLILSNLSAAIIGGFPCIAYQENNVTSLTISLVFQQALTPDGSVWSAPIYIRIDAAPTYVTLLDVRGRPAICYYVHNSPGGVHYAFSAP